MENDKRQDHLDTYRRYVKHLATTRSSFVFPNLDHDHAAIVVQNMIETAKNDVYIYEDAIDGDITENRPILIEAFTSFLAQNKKLNIIIRDHEKNDRTCKIYETLRDFQKTGQASVMLINKKHETFDEEFGLFNNFLVTDSFSYRLEKEDPSLNRRSAYCSFNGVETSKKLITLFGKIKGTSETYYLN